MSSNAFIAIAMGHGRLGRLGYLREFLAGAAVYLVFDRAMLATQGQMSPILALTTIPIIWILLSSLVRRTHDIGHSGWLSIILLVVSWGTGIQLLMHGIQTWPTALAVLALTYGPFAIAASLPGDPLPNRWGVPSRRPDPKDQGSIGVVQ